MPTGFVSYLEQSDHIFELNGIWEDFLKYLKECWSDSSGLFEGKDEIYHELYSETNDPDFDSLTQECLEIICCTCAIVAHSQLKYQLPGDQYYDPFPKCNGLDKKLS